jgi:hypothetical protein
MLGIYELWFFRKIAPMEAEIQTNCYSLQQLSSLNYRSIVTFFLKCLCEKCERHLMKIAAMEAKTQMNSIKKLQHSLFSKNKFQYFRPIYAKFLKYLPSPTKPCMHTFSLVPLK